MGVLSILTPNTLCCASIKTPRRESELWPMPMPLNPPCRSWRLTSACGCGKLLRVRPTMSIDAVIDAVKRHPTKTELWIRPRIDSEGLSTIAGRRHLLITVNPDYAPQTGDPIWG